MKVRNKPLFTLEIEAGAGTGYVVVDSVVNNTSSGGVRIATDMSRDEVRALAREMTLKFSFMGLTRGGGKSGVQIPAGISQEQKLEILTEYGRGLGPLIRAGIYYPGMDMNCGPNELRAIYAGAGMKLGDKITDTSYFTAISVANAIVACTETCEIKTPVTIAIEGFGSVGAYLAERLPADVYRIVAISTITGAVACPEGFSSAALVQLRRQFGDDLVTKTGEGRAISKEELLAADVDILVPAARILSLHGQNVDKVRARHIVPVANAPYTEEAIDALFARGVVCLPGFVVNSGGVYASTLSDSSVPLVEIERISRSLYKKVVASLLRRSAELKRSPVRVAESVALARLEAQERMVLPSRIMRKVFQKRLLPRGVYGKMVATSFCENLETLDKRIKDFQC